MAIVVMAFAVLILAAVAGITCLIRIHSASGLFWVGSYQGRMNLRQVACTLCDGWGAQWLDPATHTWTIYPLEYRSHVKGRATWQIAPNKGNSRLCPRCFGVGFLWVRK